MLNHFCVHLTLRFMHDFVDGPLLGVLVDRQIAGNSVYKSDVLLMN